MPGRPMNPPPTRARRRLRTVTKSVRLSATEATLLAELAAADELTESELLRAILRTEARRRAERRRPA